jgi:hypothetical protein
VSVVHAQTTQFFIPSPAGMIVSAGKWIYDALTDEKVYYIEVTGVGSTADQARASGFRLAVEQAIGSLIASETEVQNGRIKRDEIISYASGYVRRFEIVNTQDVGRGVQTTMKVWVSRSALSNRLLSESKNSAEIDGTNASAALATIQYERSQGDRLLQTVLNDYPRRAFDVDVKRTTVSFNGYRQGQVNVPIQIRWNWNYLTSLWTALEATAQNKSAGNCYNYQSKCNNASYIRVISGRPPASSSSWIGWNGTAGYNDYVKIQQIAAAFVKSQPAVLVTIRNTTNEVVHRNCYRWPELDHNVNYNVPKMLFVEFGQNQASVNGDLVFNGQVNIPITAEKLEDLSRLQAEIVVGQACPN